MNEQALPNVLFSSISSVFYHNFNIKYVTLYNVEQTTCHKKLNLLICSNPNFMFRSILTLRSQSSRCLSVSLTCGPPPPDILEISSSRLRSAALTRSLRWWIRCSMLPAKQNNYCIMTVVIMQIYILPNS